MELTVGYTCMNTESIMSIHLPSALHILLGIQQSFYFQVLLLFIFINQWRVIWLKMAKMSRLRNLSGAALL